MVTTSAWGASEYLEDEQDAIAYINAAAELDGPALLQTAIGDVAKALGGRIVIEPATA
ncbi:helix-turn-helix domain-containing transcriptional regulator [Bifidobacterium pullorum]|uniref:helix-turn-helix domain-containing transcriptional regulator n=1 Tax=Bifidobacterium pullorum TaxID=78448 RepID=UPI001D0BED6E